MRLIVAVLRCVSNFSDQTVRPNWFTEGEPITFEFWYTEGDPEPVHPDGAVLVGDFGILVDSNYYWRSYLTSGLAAYVVEFPFELNCNYPNKSYVCHNGNTICVNTASVQAHLDHGDFEGPCGPCNTYSMQTYSDGTIESEGHSLDIAEVKHSDERDIQTENIEFNEIGVYPNPVSEKLTIVLPAQLQRGNLKMLSLTGQVIQVIDLHEQESMMIDVSDYAAGIYLIDVRSSNGHYQKKIVKL